MFSCTTVLHLASDTKGTPLHLLKSAIWAGFFGL